MKRLIGTILCVVILFGLQAFADSEIEIFIFGERLEFDVPPVIVDDRTLVPMRAIFEVLGANVGWFEEEQMIVAQMRDSDMWIEMTIDNPIANVMGEDLLMDVPPQIIHNRTMVPLRFIAESMNLYVSWNQWSKTVVIDKHGTLIAEEPDLTGNIWRYYIHVGINSQRSLVMVNYANNYVYVFHLAPNGMPDYDFENHTVFVADDGIYFMLFDADSMNHHIPGGWLYKIPFLHDENSQNGERVIDSIFGPMAGQVIIDDGYIFYTTRHLGSQSRDVLLAYNWRTGERTQLYWPDTFRSIGDLRLSQSYNGDMILSFEIITPSRPQRAIRIIKGDTLEFEVIPQ